MNSRFISLLPLLLQIVLAVNGNPTYPMFMRIRSTTNAASTASFTTFIPETKNPVVSPLLPTRCPSPPCICDVDDQQRKRVTCMDSLSSIPHDKMDPDTQVINITSKSYNSLKLGAIFTKMNCLEEIHITRSRLSAIGGHYTFRTAGSDDPTCAGIRVLNLSQNNIVALMQDDFYHLKDLEILDLSDNKLDNNIPSAVFSHLERLMKLSLAQNKLNQLVPLIFFGLTNLEELDLSENPLSSISSDQFKGLKSLLTLNLQGCQLTRIENETFKELSTLQYLDLSDNHIKHLSRTSFSGLISLQVLKLNRNSLTTLPDNLFARLDLDYLDLSKNLINPMSNCVFCEVKGIKHLDLSSNKISSFSDSLLGPLARTLRNLSINSNTKLIDAPSSLMALTQPLLNLTYLSATDIGLDESLPESAFENLNSLHFLNLSNNKFTELNSGLLLPLRLLEKLDVSNNKLSIIDPSTFQTLQNMGKLSEVYLQGNPYSCYRCHILPFIGWLNTDPMEYWKVCQKFSENPEQMSYCARCSVPSSMEGRYLHELNADELEFCTNPEVQLRLTATEPQVGLILALLIILSLVALILVVVAVYRKHGAVYYTQEDKLTSKEEIYAAAVGSPQPLTYTPNNGSAILTSSNFTTSRQNTMFSPQSSMEQPQQLVANYGINGTPAVITTSVPHESKCSNDVCNTIGCNECANNRAVKQVIASIPAMTEMLEKMATNQMNGQHSNGHTPKMTPNGTSTIMKTQPNKRSSMAKEVVLVEDKEVPENKNIKPNGSLLPPIEVDHYEDVDLVKSEFNHKNDLSVNGSGGGNNLKDEANVHIYI